MESDRDVSEHESSAKRAKYDVETPNFGELCDRTPFATVCCTPTGPIDVAEGVSIDCDSGYEASTRESPPTCSEQTSPPGEPNAVVELHLTPSRVDYAETSQDSAEMDDDNTSTVSEISGLSDLSGLDWKPMVGSMIWIQRQMQSGVNPRDLLDELGVELVEVPQYVEEVTLWKLIINMLTKPPKRNKLKHINTLEDVVRLVKGSQNIIVLTGAGVSVSCGIPDFRSRDGIYSRLAKDFPDLPDPQAMFDINYFSRNPRPFYKFARDIYPGKFEPSPSHRFIKLMEKNGKLLRNYTQNIDTLEKVAEIDRVMECHGSFATATCTKCSHKVTADVIRDVVLAQRIPLCPKCHPDKDSIPIMDDDDDDEDTNPSARSLDYSCLVSEGIMKPDIVFFGEGLPDTFHEAMSADKDRCDLLLVIGSSLKVRPVALIPSSLPAHVPQILINREPLPHCHFDVELLGDCDVIVNYLCHLFGGEWKEGIVDETILVQSQQLLPRQEPLLPPPPPIMQESSSTTNFDPSNSSSSSSSNHMESFYYPISTVSEEDSVTSLDLKSDIKRRHMSIDSTRDSGIEENSNLTDAKTLQNDKSDAEDVNVADFVDMWQRPKNSSLAERLPTDSFYHLRPNRYIFPGAEVAYDDNHHEDEDDDDDDNDVTSVSSDDDGLPGNEEDDDVYSVSSDSQLS